VPKEAADEEVRKLELAEQVNLQSDRILEDVQRRTWQSMRQADRERAALQSRIDQFWEVKIANAREVRRGLHESCHRSKTDSDYGLTPTIEEQIWGR